MIGRDRIAAGVLLVFGLGGVLETRRLSIGDAGHPGPGFFPFWLALGLSVVAVVLLLARRSAPAQPAAAPGERVRRDRVLLALAASAVYAFALEPLGFVLSTSLFLLFMLSIIEPQGWVSSIAISIVTSAACHLLFKVWLDVQLPAGPWGF